MARKSNDQTLKTAIGQMLKDYHLDTKITEMKVIASWEKVMGKTVSSRTTDIQMRGRKLYVKLNSASLREELFNGKEKMLALLNQEAGELVLDDVILR